MNDKIFNFNESLDIGASGENRLFNHFVTLAGKDRVKKLDGISGDLMLINTKGEQAKVEVKTDTYKDTPNFCFEHYKNLNRPIDKREKGSVWQANRDKCKFFCYYFVNQDVAYIWEVDDLLAVLEDNNILCEILNRKVKVTNSGSWGSYQTENWLIDRDELLKVCPPWKTLHIC